MRNEAIAGGCAGVVGTVLGFPLDCIKTRMQTTHKSLFNASKLIFSESVFIGFYRGVAAPLLSLTVLNTLNFSSYSYFRILFRPDVNRSSSMVMINNHLFDWRVPLSAALVGPLSSCISTPFEFVKTQMQLNQRNNFATSSSIKTAQHIVATRGIRTLYTGHAVNTLREMVFLATYFTVYENNKLLLSANEHVSTNHHVSVPQKSIVIAFSGGLAGAMGWLVSFPLDLIKSNIQGQSLTGMDVSKSIVRRSAYAVGRELIQTRGFLGLYSGVVPSLLRAFLVSSSRFLVYEGVLQALGESNSVKR